LSPVRSRTQSRSDTFAQQAVEDAVARERARIARELHDGIATELAGAISLFKVYLESRKGQPDETLKNVFDILERSLKHVRESLAELRPAASGPLESVAGSRLSARKAEEQRCSFLVRTSPRFRSRSYPKSSPFHLHDRKGQVIRGDRLHLLGHPIDQRAGVSLVGADCAGDLGR